MRLAARLLRGERVALLLSGDSMRPLLESGDTVILRAPDLRELGPGMIVAASYRHVLWLHRIAEIGETPEGQAWVGLRGDGVRGPGEQVPVSHILGVAEARLRKGGLLPLHRLGRHHDVVGQGEPPPVDGSISPSSGTPAPR